MKNNKLTSEIVFSGLVITVGVLTRTVWHIGPNIEFVTALSLLIGVLFTNKILKYLVPVLIMFVSDAFIGNSSIFIFTWSGFILAPIIGRLIKNSKVPKLVGAELGGLVSVAWFFLWTNFGVVLISGTYAKTLGGILSSYANGLPFLVNQLVGNLFIIPLVFVIGEKIYQVLLKTLSLNFKNKENINY